MAWLFVTALRLSEWEVTLQYPKFAFIVFCAVFAARISFSAWRAGGSVVLAFVAVFWLALAAALTFLALKTYHPEWFGGMAALGAAIALVPLPRRIGPRVLALAQVLGLLALAGGFLFAVVGALP